MRKSSGPKRNIWTDPSPYGTYEGEPGNPTQWKEAFQFTYDKKTASILLKGESAYTILNVLPTASHEEIKSAYRKLALVHHPDKGGNEETFKKIHAAYSFLVG
jgi:DnaJ-domain-containing protein 1